MTKGDTVYRYHSFLRIAYDNLFQGRWDVKARMMNKYNKNEPLLHQLTFPQLFFVYKITKKLENKRTLLRLNIESLRYRKKLKYPIEHINYRENPEYYIINIKKYIPIKPYSEEIDLTNNDNIKINNLVLKYIKNDDFIGQDLIKKYSNINKIKELIENNEKYKKWINNFNWKNANPYEPKKCIY